MLLDDVFDKLDEKRVGKLIELVGSRQFGQVFITDTDQERLERILNAKKLSYNMFTIENENNIHVTAFAN